MTSTTRAALVAALLSTATTAAADTRGAGNTDAPLTQHGNAAIAVTDHWFDTAPSNAVVFLRNTGPTPLVVGPPAVVSARRVDKLDAPTRDFQVAGVEAFPWSVRIEPGRAAAVPVAMIGLDDPGVYRVDVMFPIEGHEPSVLELQVTRRKHWVAAAFWIALGALLAYAVRRFVQGGQARLKVRRHLAAARPRVAAVRIAASEPAHVAAAMMLAADLERLERDVRWHEDGTKLLEAATRFGARVQLLDEIIAAARTVALLDAAAQVAPRAVLDAALTKVKVDPDKLSDVEDARATVVQLATRDELRKQLRAGVDELRQAIAALAQGAILPSTSERLDEEALPVLGKAGAALSAGDLDGAHGHLTAARTAYVAVAVADLTERVGRTPLGTDAPRWAPVAAAVKAQLLVAGGGGDWKARSDAFLAAERAYYKGALTALAEHARKALADQAHPPRDAKALEKLAADIEAALATGGAVLDDAARGYARLLAAVEAAAATGEAPISSGLRTVLSSFAGAFTDVSATEAATPPEVRAADAAIRHTDWLVTAAVLVVAVASGVKALWAGNLSWGGDGAALTAFLWGAGVGSAGEVFAGLVGLREKLGAGT